ncbi:MULTISPECIES: DUF1958 domain-containing protein [Staphylococcus]|uniref:DUF1958 domain-containing protein n=1 Tax=Staphylococcus hsinchuensis TaxID=3051183 RepID=A0ABZ3EB00_9STAP|nr:DUF1958 domain-containing protein [Staphylococcus sp. Marseille-Q5304]
MKKLGVILSFLILLSIYAPLYTFAGQSPYQIAENEHIHVNKQNNPKSAQVTTKNGQILYNYNIHKQVDPASTTKLMTLALILDDIKHKKFNFYDTVKIDLREQKMSQIPNLTTFPLKTGQTFSILQLVKQAMLESSNAATLVLAEEIDGNSSHFTNRMNKKAKQIGMQNTHFTNPSGANIKLLKPFAPKQYQNQTYSYTTANDMSLLSHYILNHYPEALKITSLKSDLQYHKSLHNTNTSLPSFPDGMKDVDGLKTGTSDNGYNLVLTAKRNHLRVISTLFNTQPYPSDKAKHARQQISNGLIKHAFDHYEYRKVLTKGRHTINGKVYKVKHDLYDVVPTKLHDYSFKISDDNTLTLNYKRTFLKGAHPPSVEVEPVINWKQIITYIFIAILLIFIIIMIFVLKNTYKKKHS